MLTSLFNCSYSQRRGAKASRKADARSVSVRAIGVGLAVALALGILAASRVAPPVDAAPRPCRIEGVERIIALGDVHGAYDRFVEILRTTGILDARLHWSGGRTHLVQMGDIVDRGADSRKVLDLLRRLEKEATRARGAVHVLLGNHEAMRMLGDLRYVSPGEYEAFLTPTSEETRERFVQAATPAGRDPLLKETPLGFVEMRVAFGRDGQYGRWLRNLDTVITINGVLFVHGGISPAVSALGCDVINATVRRELTTDLAKTRAELPTSLVSGEEGPIWYRGLAQEPETFGPQVEEILSKQNARVMVIAHTVVPDGRILVRFGGKVVQIDTGMQSAYFQTGRAAALEIQDGVFTAIYQDRRDVLFGTPAETPKAMRAQIR